MKKTIFALATGSQLSALSIIRVSGNESKKIIEKLTHKKVPKEKLLSLRSFYFPDDKWKIIDKCLLAWMPGPNSYTGEDSLEIYCHGGEATFQSFFQALSSFKNVMYAEQGEFSKRAIINGKIDLVEAEAINDLIRAQTEQQRDLALRQYTAGLSLPVMNWRKTLINCMTLVEAIIDFSDEDDIPTKLNIDNQLLNLKKEIKVALQNNDCYELINQGIKVVFKGKPNAGKSSIFNSIIKKERSIVSNSPGTTRDIIESKINYKGHAITFFDTAGITKTKNNVEKEGIKRTKELLKEADIILNITEGKDVLHANKDKREWLVLNKIDLNSTIKKNVFREALPVSAKTGEGINELLNKIYKEILAKTKKLENSQALVSNSRQAEELKEAEIYIDKAIKEKSEEIKGEYIRHANRCLERILGNIDIEEVLGNIFSNFCIGK